MIVLAEFINESKPENLEHESWSMLDSAFAKGDLF